MTFEPRTPNLEPRTSNVEPDLVHDLLVRAAARFPDKVFLVRAGREITYKALLGWSGAVASWLASRGVLADDRVGILLDDPFAYVAAYFGILMAGGVVVALNTQTSTRSIETVLNDCGVSALLTHRKFWKFVHPVLEAVPTLRAVAVAGGVPEPRAGGPSVEALEDVLEEKVLGPRSKVQGREPGTRNPEPVTGAPAPLAQIIYTSGTTGSPKGVMLTHANLVANTRSIVEYLRLTDQDRVMAVLPFFYSYGNSLLLTHVAVGGTLVVNQSFLYPNVILDQMVSEEVTGFSGVPSTFAILLNRSSIRDYRFPHLRYVTQAGGAMSPKLAAEIKRILPGADVFIMYGQTEASARLSYLPPEDLLRKAGSIGKAIPGVTLRVLRPDGAPAAVGEVGEIVARGPNVMAGYWGKPEETARVLRDGDLWTGDLARVDEEGYLYIVSRKSDMIKSGAHRIAPKEIEEILLENPAVHEAAVVGAPDEILGESIKACVVLKDGAACTARDLLRHCKRHLPAFKVPHEVVFFRELPKTASGKIRKGEL